jgi:hypothetical protein
VFDSVVNLGIWNDAQLAIGANSRPRGVVTAVGWTRDYDGPADVPGQGSLTGRSAVVGRAPVTSPDGTLARGAAHRELVRGPRGTELPDGDVAARVQGALWRFALPDGTGGRPLELDVPAYVGRVDAWDGTGWVTVHDELADAASFNGDITRVDQATLAPGLSASGEVWLRGWVLADFGFFDGNGLDLADPAAPA